MLFAKQEHKELKKQVNEAEDQRSVRRGHKSWYELRTLKKLKLRAKEVLKGVTHTWISVI